MSNNEAPRSPRAVIAKLEDAADGCQAKEVEIGLTLIKEETLRGTLLSLNGDEDADPPIFGLIYLYDQAKRNTAAARTALKNKDAEAKKFLSDARDVLKKGLGTAPSADWVLAGYTEPGSTAVPETQDDRFASLNALRQYLTANPGYQVAGSALIPEVTPARAQALRTQISDARSAIDLAETAQGQAKAARDAAVTEGRKNLIALVGELTRRLSPDDPRWEAFGLNIPNNPRAPDAATNLQLTGAGPQRVHATWRPGVRSDDDKVFIQVVGVDEDFRYYGRSGGDGDILISDLPSNATVRVKIIALNGSLEAADGPVGEISVP